MELADMQDLGSCVFDVQVQVLSSAPRRSKRCIACSDFLLRCAAVTLYVINNDKEKAFSLSKH